MNQIRMNKISFTYDKEDVIHEVSLTIQKHEGCILLAGKNGSGKSTLLNLLTGVLLPYAGEVIRESITIGYLPFDSPLCKQLSILDNLRYYYRIFHGKDLSLEDPFIQSIMFDLDIDYVDQRFDKCSSGQQQKAGIAMILMSGVDMVIMDEPFVAMDAKSTINLLHLIQKMKKTTTFVLTSHTSDHLESLVDRLIVVNDTEIAMDTCDQNQIHAYITRDNT